MMKTYSWICLKRIGLILLFLKIVFFINSKQDNVNNFFMNAKQDKVNIKIILNVCFDIFFYFVIIFSKIINSN